MDAGLKGILWKMLSVVSVALHIKDCTRRSEPILSADVTAALLAGLAAARSRPPMATPAEFGRNSSLFVQLYHDQAVIKTCDSSQTPTFAFLSKYCAC